MVNASTDLKDEWRSEIPPCWSQEPAITMNSDREVRSWQVYWESLSDSQQLFREQSEEYLRNLDIMLRIDPRARVLDFGCGFGHVAEMLSSRVEELFLWDASANMRSHARLKLDGQRNIKFLDLSDPKTPPHDLRFDLILVNSVVQYMTLDEFSTWLLRWRKMLAPGGRIVVSDLIPPDYQAIWDIVDLLRLSVRRGFLVRAIWQALGEIWRYRSTRRAQPLSRIGREELSERGRAVGLAFSCLPSNLTFFTRRFSGVFFSSG